MKTVFFRVDEKFIHAQFIHGWLPFISAKRIIGVSEKFANDPESRQIYCDAVPGDIMTSIITPKEAVKNSIGESETERVAVLFSSLEDLRVYYESGGIVKTLNLGGIYPRENRRKLLPYIYLSDDEIDFIMKLKHALTDIYCQDAPHSEQVEFSNLLAKK